MYPKLKMPRFQSASLRLAHLTTYTLLQALPIPRLYLSNPDSTQQVSNFIPFLKDFLDPKYKVCYFWFLLPYTVKIMHAF